MELDSRVSVNPLLKLKANFMEKMKSCEYTTSVDIFFASFNLIEVIDLI
jgi:hypothetical protein